MAETIRGLYDRLLSHIGDIAGGDVKRKLTDHLNLPEAGITADRAPVLTEELVRVLKTSVAPDIALQALTANTHGIPDSAFESDRERFLAAPDLPTWLADNHRRAVEVLEQHAESGDLWWEQKITPEVAAWVKQNPRVLGGEVVDGRILFTKIPFDPDAWLRETDADRKRYLYCHCPLARQSLKDRGAGIDPDWCRCSAGFVKRRFDVAFGMATRAEVLETVMAGDETCTFAITLPAGPPAEGAPDHPEQVRMGHDPLS